MDEINAELQLLARHLSGLSTPEEESRMQDWLAADPTHPRVLDSLRDAWGRSTILTSARYDPDSAWESILRRIQAPAAGPKGGEEASAALIARRSVGKSHSIFDSGLWRAAAVVLLLIGSGLVWSFLTRVPSLMETALEVEVPRGQEATVRLPDGSRVVLAPESKLRYPRSFGEHSRELQLEGMAYFEVSHDPSRPFEVHAGGGITRVLGTRFVIRAYPDAPRVEVAVADGSVSLRADSVPLRRAVPFTSGQVARLDPDGVTSLEPDRAARLYLAWMDGQPVIHDLPLNEALAELERWYEVKLSVGDPQLASRRITTTIERSSLKETLAVIALALDAKLVRSGDTMVFLRKQ